MKKNLIKYWYLVIAFLLVIVVLVKNVFVKSLSFLSTTNPLTDLQAQNYADGLHVAMGSGSPDFERIKVIFSKLNRDSFKQVYNAFGLRSYLDMFGGHGTDLPFATKLNLLQWLNVDLDEEQKKELNSLHPYLF